MAVIYIGIECYDKQSLLTLLILLIEDVLLDL
jgi:hypothetical protein